MARIVGVLSVMLGCVLFTRNARERMRVNEWQRGVPNDERQRLRLAILMPVAGIMFVVVGLTMAVRG